MLFRARGLTPDEENPHAPSRPPWHSTSNRLTFRPVTLRPAGQDPAPSPAKKGRRGQPATSDFPSASPALGPSLHHVSLHSHAGPSPSVAPITEGMSNLTPSRRTTVRGTPRAMSVREGSAAEAGPSRLRDSPAASSPLVSVSDLGPEMSTAIEGVIGVPAAGSGTVGGSATQSQSPSGRERSTSPAGTRQKKPSKKTHIATLTDLLEINARRTQIYHRCASTVIEMPC